MLDEEVTIHNKVFNKFSKGSHQKQSRGIEMGKPYSAAYTCEHTCTKKKKYGHYKRKN